MSTADCCISSNLYKGQPFPLSDQSASCQCFEGSLLVGCCDMMVWSFFVQIRDVSTMKTVVFHGRQQFFWQSTGSQAEIEFHENVKDQQTSFWAEYRAVEPQ